MEAKKNFGRNLDLTEGSPIKVIILFTLPLLFGNLFQQLYNVMDSFVVGNFVSDEALGAVSSSGSLIMFFISLIQGISVGAGIVIAQHFGAKNIAKMRSCIHTTIVFNLILGVILTIAGYFLSPLILKMMQTPEEVLPLSIAYFQTYFLGVIFTVLYNCGSSIFRAIGDSKTPLYYLIVASIINVGLDLLFVCIFHLGVKGTAYATICSQFISALLTFLKLFLSKTEYQISWKELKIDKNELKNIIAYGIPMGIQNSIISLSNVFIQSNINAFGPFAQAGCGSYQKIEGFATMPSGSFSMAISTYVGQNIGAKKYKRMKKGAIEGLILALGITEGIGIILNLFAPQFIRIFSDTPEVISYGVSQIHIITGFYFLLAFSHTASGILRGAGYSKTPMVISLLFWVVVRIIGIPIALHIDGWNQIQTIFWFYPFTWTLSTISFILCLIFFPWHKERKTLKDNN